MDITRVSTNLWHPDLGLRFLGVVGRREACDGRQTRTVSAWTLRVLGLVELESVLAKDVPRENGVSASPSREWKQAG